MVYHFNESDSLLWQATSQITLALYHYYPAKSIFMPDQSYTEVILFVVCKVC